MRVSVEIELIMTAFRISAPLIGKFETKLGSAMRAAHAIGDGRDPSKIGPHAQNSEAQAADVAWWSR